MIPISYYVALSAIVFITGMVGVLIRRNIIIILLSIELIDRKSTRLNSSHIQKSRMPSSA